MENKNYIYDSLLSNICSKEVFGSYIFYGRNIYDIKKLAIDFLNKFIGYDEKYLDNIIIFNKDRGNIGINDIREIKNEILKKSTLTDKKGILINNAENMSIEAQNACLKMLEDRNENLIIILLTDNLNKILKTVTSRCILINFNSMFDDSKDMFKNIFLQDDCAEIYRVILKSFNEFISHNLLKFRESVDKLIYYKDNTQLIIKVLNIFIRDIFIYRETLNINFISNHIFVEDIINLHSNFEKFNIDNIILELDKLKERVNLNLNLEMCYKIFMLKVGR